MITRARAAENAVFIVVPDQFHGRPLGWMGWGFRRPDVYAKYLLDRGRQ
jgi:hypothetical protein